MNELLSNLRGATMVLEAAEELNLPLPTYMWTSRRCAGWIADSTDEVHAWAVYMDVMVDHSAGRNGAVHHRAEGTVFDQRIEICYIEHAAARVA